MHKKPINQWRIQDFSEGGCVARVVSQKKKRNRSGWGGGRAPTADMPGSATLNINLLFFCVQSNNEMINDKYRKAKMITEGILLKLGVLGQKIC